jgi:hypothetical protein
VWKGEVRVGGMQEGRIFRDLLLEERGTEPVLVGWAFAFAFKTVSHMFQKLESKQAHTIGGRLTR